MRGLILIFLFPLLTASCIKVEKKRLNAFLDIDSLVSAQIVVLNDAQPKLQKTGVIDGDNSETEIVPDSMQWVRELGVFRQANLNKPRLVELYTTTSQKEESGATLTIHTSVRPADTRVQWLKIRENPGLVSLEAMITDKNPVYGSRKLIEMMFSGDSKGMIKSYSIIGGERLKAKDTVSYELHARILPN